MFLLHKATQVTDPVPESGTELNEWLKRAYAYPAGDKPYLRVNFVASVDGSATIDGRSGGLANAGDKLIFHVLRELADAIIVGARTAVTENYGAPERGLLILVSASLSIPVDYEALSSSRVVVVTSKTADAARRAQLVDAGATIIDGGETAVDLPALVDYCRERGHTSLLCEGGPSLFGSLLADDLVDELCLTTSPTLAGGVGSRIAHGPNPIDLRRVQLDQLIGDDDGYLYARWTRRA
ncbi:dihydrofolate reductase family protein [Gordonia effusa]|uniref:dihydrofolate reductase family protein n=1 Tax=Gordonia effusa TaxID=263908 RepID=UPI000681AE2C|nr:dihydrofolate reductase family protein [Gordonia effusa]